ncbi:hypothetical protein VTH06DRAFT_3205 [Thermothelomyces fergusii]
MVRLSCPLSLYRDPRCPYYLGHHVDYEGPRVRPFSVMWVDSHFVRRGNHRSLGCADCPALYQPGNIDLQMIATVECDSCSDRLRAARRPGRGERR